MLSSVSHLSLLSVVGLENLIVEDFPRVPLGRMFRGIIIGCTF